MTHNEARIGITRSGNRITSVSVTMPVWTKESKECHLIIDLPFLGLETIAKDEADSETAIKEAIMSFCIIAEKFGQGLEKELKALGWTPFNETTGEPMLGYDSKDPDSLIDRLIQTGESYVNPKLEFA